MNVLGLCAGIGGVELGLSVVEDVEPVAFVEGNAFCQSVLRRRWPGVRIIDDVASVDGAEFRGVDIITAGFPCQPWSAAGKQGKTQDSRWLWPIIADIVRDAMPRYVFLENVPGLLGGGIQEVCKDLAAMGFDAEWGVFSCRALGAPHLRRRLFLLAYSKKDSEWYGQAGIRDDDSSTPGGGKDMANANANGEGLAQRQEQHHEQRQAVERSGLPFWPYSPDSDWSEVAAQWWPAEFPVCGMADGFPRSLEPDRRARLQALGNAVSPPVAACAWRVLKARIR